MRLNIIYCLLPAIFIFFQVCGFAQNLGVNTDGSLPETGVMLDVKGSNAKAATAVQSIFQVKSGDVSTDALKLRLGLGTNVTATSRYAFIDAPDYVGNAVSAYRHLALQPSGGNVGIGTTAPASLFHVNGAARLGTASTTSGSLIFNQSASAFAITIQPQAGALTAGYTLTLPPNDGAASQVLSTNGAGILSWVTDANAGGDITDVTAGAGLTGGGAGPGAVTVTAAANNGLNVDVAQDMIQLGGALTEATTITQGAFAFTMNNSGAANTTINLSSTGDFDVQNAGVTSLFVRDDGNVGIGTASPGFKLHVPSGYIGADYVNTTDNSVAAGITGVMIKAGDNYLRTGTAAGVTTFLNTNNGWIQNQIASAQATSNYWISGTGRANRLLIDGASLATGNLQFTAANPYITATSYIIMPGGLHVSGGTLYAQNQMKARGGIHNDLGAYLAIAGGTTGFTSFAGGVGVNGVTSSTYALEVNGRIKSTSVNESSDIRWKKDISTLPDALTKVKELRGVNYKWRVDEFKDKEFDSDTQIGLIAQEVEKIYPELVCTDKEGFKSVEYSKIVAVLIEAMKEQQKQFDAQQNKIEELQKTVAELVKVSSIGATAETKDK